MKIPDINAVNSNEILIVGLINQPLLAESELCKPLSRPTQVVKTYRNNSVSKP